MADAAEKTIYRRVKDWLNSVPDCPRCKGTGEAQGVFGETVWWKGRQMWACDCCGGSGIAH